jgi:hypothetical protein
MPDLDAQQRIGFEVECADVTLQMQKRSCDSYGLAGDTYGVVLMQTQETDARTGRPRMEVVLEERKGSEDPKIEFITAPWEHGATALQRLKRYVNAVLDLTANGTVAQWATAASRLAYSPTLTFHWEVADSYRRSGLAPLKVVRNTERRAARLAQCNVDLYLSQWYSAPAFLKTMMDAQRQRFYDAARASAHTWRTAAGAGGDDELGGLLTLALYSAICDERYTPAQALARANALVKDRIQPLPKIGASDLARLVLTQVQRTHLATIVEELVAGTQRATTWLSRLSQACSTSNRAIPSLQTAVRESLSDWFYAPNSRYLLGTIQERIAHMNAGAARKDNLRTGGGDWDELDAGDAYVQCPGTSVWWGGRGGSPGTPTGKPVSPRLLDNRPTMVAEVRQTGHAFSKTYWGNIRA